jgi:hypothetical protein
MEPPAWQVVFVNKKTLFRRCQNKEDFALILWQPDYPGLY